VGSHPPLARLYGCKAAFRPIQLFDHLKGRPPIGMADFISILYVGSFCEFDVILTTGLTMRRNAPNSLAIERSGNDLGAGELCQRVANLRLFGTCCTLEA
jgi:hypothetical protein